MSQFYWHNVIGMQKEELKEAEEECLKKYGDILNLPAHVSPNRRQMSLYDRAAQFSAFDALSGYRDAVFETARITEQKIELSEEEESALNETLVQLSKCYPKRPKVRIVYFQEDETKEGGQYQSLTDTLRQIDVTQQKVILKSGMVIPFSALLSIEEDGREI